MLRDRLAHGNRRFAIDLTGAAIDATDLVSLIDGLADVRAAGGDLRIVDAGGANAALVARSGLDAVFRLHESVAAAFAGEAS